ncbi:hypothetical protein BT96DRAFT_1016208 [Gymnopus androsaceus JB14]|uniref:Uncharacterized protein n=1 Tax=Gymnopus androsaceus JB14 TaxID=1447944 RepID=A0A6A4I287_9AGAR|nr:hypothetical protein BT96DRAFT_1016208 [Gymnopus androsaceus JB14]
MKNGIFESKEVATKMDAHPFNVDLIEWEIVLLYPDDYLPQPQILCAIPPTLRTFQKDQLSVFTQLHIPNPPVGISSGDIPLLLGSDDKPFRFTTKTCCDNKDRLSLFAMIVNLHLKLWAYVQYQLKSLQLRSLCLLHQFVDDLYKLIFYNPPSLNSKFGIAVPVEDRASETLTNSSFPSSSISREEPTPTTSTFPMGVWDGPPEPVDDNGLTWSEQKMIMQSISTGKVTGDQRVQYISMLLHGAMGPQFQKPIRADDLDNDDSDTPSPDSDSE